MPHFSLDNIDVVLCEITLKSCVPSDYYSPSNKRYKKPRKCEA